MVETDRPQMIIQYGSYALDAGFNKSTDTHSEYLLLFDCKYSCSKATQFYVYTYIASLVLRQ